MTIEEIDAKLETIDKRIALGAGSTISELSQIFSLYEEIVGEYFTHFNQQANLISKTLFHVMECLEAEAIESIKSDDVSTRKIVAIIENLDGAFSDKSNGDALLVQFLHRLHKHESFYSQTDILDNCQVYVKRLDQIAWLFQLSLNGDKIYPIGDLLSISILDSFIPDEAHLKYLIASLQLFTENITIPEEAKKKIEEYSDLYNLKILSLLCNQGKVLFDCNKQRNMEKNAVIIVRDRTTILVRTTDLSKPPYSEISYEYEKNSKGDKIAKFFIYTLDAQEELCSLDSFYAKAPLDERIKVMEAAIEKNAYNIFMSDSLRYNTSSMHFTGWTNPTVSQDEFIITSSNMRPSKEKNFFDIIAKPSDQCIRTEIIAKQSIDILTIDFLAAFCVRVSIPAGVPASSFIPIAIEKWKSNLQTEDYATCQNQIISEFFLASKAYHVNLLSVLSSYYQFLHENLEFNKDIDYETRLVMPYSFFIPFQTDDKVFKELLSNIGVEIQDNSTQLNCQLSCDEDGTWQSDDISEEFKAIDITTGESAVTTGIGIKYKAIYDSTSQIAYVVLDPDTKAIFNTIEKIKLENKKLCISDSNIKDYAAFDFGHLESIVYNIGVSRTVLDNFWPRLKRQSISQDKMESLLIYKILCHISHFKICGEKLNDWKELIFSCHLCETCDKDYAFYSDFRNKVRVVTPDSGAIMISKQSHADKSTLEMILNEERERGMVDMAFDAQALEDHIKLIDGQYYFVEKGKLAPDNAHRIKSIIFLTDNIISGASTVQMLEFHVLGKEPDEDSHKRSYITLRDHRLICKIITVNKPDISIYTAFWFLKLGAYERSCDHTNPTFKILGETGQDLFVQIEACKTFTASDYLYTDKAFELTKKIYGKKYPRLYEAGGKKAKKDNDKRHLVFRPGNMPSFSVFPEDVLNTTKIIGLFDHRTENC